MLTKHTGSLIAAATIVTASCGGTTDVTLPDLVGEWLAHEWVYTNNGNPDEAYNVLAEGGAMELTIHEGGTYFGYATIAGTTESLIGSIAVDNGVLTMTESSDPTDISRFSLALDGNWLTLTDENTVFTHFLSAQGSAVAASTEIVLQRQ